MVWHFPEAFDAFLNLAAGQAQNGFLPLLLGQQLRTQFCESVFKTHTQLRPFSLELFSKFFYLLLVNFILAKVLYNLIHGHEQLGPGGNLTDNFMFHPDVVVLMRTEERAVGANPLTVLNANNLELPVVQRTQLFSCLLLRRRLLLLLLQQSYK
jgi:hypothetical protein